MFTGIVRELGSVGKVERASGVLRLYIKAKDLYKEAKIGCSIAVNGVCLTVTGKKNGLLSFDVMEETAGRSTLSALKEKETVNLEGALKVGDDLGGHFVTGHVDCAGTISKIDRRNGNVGIKVTIPEEFGSLIVDKGSVALDGISLTVGNIGPDSFSVHLIPHTMKATNLAARKEGDKVNVEFDILGKYVIKNRIQARESRVTERFLREHGF